MLVQDKAAAAYGKWNLPAGKVDPGETPELAAVRETKEECGLEVEIVGHVFTFIGAVTERPDKFDHAELHAYAAKVTGGQLAFPEEEILDAKWFSYEEIKAMQARGEVRAPEYVVAAIEKLRSS